MVRTIELDDIALAGGNVNLNTAKVKGTGTITAKGAPKDHTPAHPHAGASWFMY